MNAAVAAEAEAAGIWCVRADDAAASAAWTPASGQAGDVRVGVLSGDPRRSAGIRDAVLTGLRSGALSARRHRRRTGGVALVGGGPGDPGLITVRGRQLLADADVVVADRLAPRSLLDELAPSVEIVDAAKIPRGRAMAQEDINALLVAKARQGLFVVRLKGGDPFVFGRGGEELLACLRAGVPVTVVPGVSSATAVPAAAGVPVTHRGVAQEFHVISAHVPPGDQRSTVDWAALGSSTGDTGAPDGTRAPGAHRRHADSAWSRREYTCFRHCGRYPAHAAHNYHRTECGRSGRSSSGRPSAGGRRGGGGRERRGADRRAFAPAGRGSPGGYLHAHKADHGVTGRTEGKATAGG